MNNLYAFDYAISDWTDDNDVCISRKSSEFPRFTSIYTNHFSKDTAPWGSENPQHIDVFDHPIYNSSSLRPGVWYFGGIPGTDHLDLCGFPPYLTLPRTFLH